MILHQSCSTVPGDNSAVNIYWGNESHPVPMHLQQLVWMWNRRWSCELQEEQKSNCGGKFKLWKLNRRTSKEPTNHYRKATRGYGNHFLPLKNLTLDQGSSLCPACLWKLLPALSCLGHKFLCGNNNFYYLFIVCRPMLCYDPLQHIASASSLLNGPMDRYKSWSDGQRDYQGLTMGGGAAYADEFST